MSNINVVQSCWNFAQLKEIKNKPVAKIWSLQLKKQRFGATIMFPEGLENIPCKYYLEVLAMREVGFEFHCWKFVLASPHNMEHNLVDHLE